MTRNITGKIKSVMCKHFVTYEEVLFTPSEFLNVIIGPNGTGKSTLVSAIVIGLGGDPKLLNRSTSVQDYIKNGRTSAKIIINIYEDNYGNIVSFERQINSVGKSEFKVNEEVMSKSKFVSAVANFKIQIGNLCQFLPQDRVHDFAKMNPQELFANTVKSVCSPEEIATFDELKTLRADQSSRNDRLQRDTQTLRNITVRLEELKVVLERYTRRREIVEKLKICTAKQSWMEVFEMEEKRKSQIADKDAAKKLLEKTEKEFTKIKRKQDSIFQTKVQLKEEADRKNAVCIRLFEELKAVITQLEQLHEKVKAAKRTFELRKRDYAAARDELYNEVHMLQAITKDLLLLNQQGNSIDDCNIELRNVNEQILNFREKVKERVKTMTAINNQLVEQFSPRIQALKAQIERDNSLQEQKYQLLQTKFPKVYDAVKWLQKNHQKFRGKIYNPILLELNVSDPNNAKYIENSIMLRDLLAFTCENKDDLSELINELCVKQQMGINAVYSPPASAINYEPSHPIASLHQYGFNAYLIDLIDGPASILNYLCSISHIHQIPIGGDQVNQNTEHIPSHIRLYYGGNKRYQSSVSKYSGEVSIMQNHISSKELICSVDVGRVEAMKRELNKVYRESDLLKNKRTEIENEIKELEIQCDEERNKKRSFERRIADINHKKQMLEQQKKKVERLKSSTIDIPKAEKMFMDEAEGCLKSIVELEKKRICALRAYQKGVAEKKFSFCKQSVYNHQSEDLESQLKEVSDRKNSQRQTYETILRALKVSEKKLEDKTEQSKSTTNGFAPNDHNFPFKKEFCELPDTLSELNDLSNDYSARLECMTDVDEGVVREFEQKKADLAQLQGSIYEIQSQEKDLETKIDNIFKDWYNRILSIISDLNDHFGTFMQSMQYVGEVNLIRKEAFDFDSYGIQIMVQYRREVPLQALDRYTQSGGERAVAIAVYSLALQHNTHVPFRCVDEINQGMDSRNERKIFEMLVNETTSEDSRSQYFFVTPKLLPGLVSNPRMTVHIVFNGKFVKPENSI